MSCQLAQRRGIGREGAKFFSIFLRQLFWLAVFSANHVSGCSCSEDAMVRVAQKFVGISHDAIAGLRNTRSHPQQFVVTRWRKIPATGFGYHDVAVIFGFHLLVFEAERAHQFDAADFKPDQVVGVIDHAHLIGFGVPHSNRRVVIRLAGIESHSSFQTGLRFSRNDATPSLKSPVQRMRAFSSTARSRSASTPAASALTSRRFARVRLPGLTSIKYSANSSARDKSLSGSTISVTRPSCCASLASILRPVRSRSRARLSPIWRVRNTDTIAGKKPMRTSV